MSLDCYCDYDPATFYNLSLPKTRKRHACEECSGAILEWPLGDLGLDAGSPDDIVNHAYPVATHRS